MSNLDQQDHSDPSVDRRIDNRRSIDSSPSITLSIPDLFKVLALIGALVGSWLTINKQISDIALKQTISELQYVEMKQSMEKLDGKMEIMAIEKEKEKVKLENQLHDLENSLNQIYQKVTSRK